MAGDRDINIDLNVNTGDAQKNIQGVEAAMTGLGNKVQPVIAHTKNLHEHFTKLGELTKGLTGIMRIAGEAFGLDAEQVKILGEVHSATREAMRSVGDVTRATTQATKEATVATEAQTVANEELGESWLAALGPLGLVIAGLTALGAGIAIYVAHTKAAKEAEKERSKAVDGSIITDKKQRDSFNEHVVVMTKLRDQYKVLTGAMSDTEEKMDELTVQYKVDIANLQNETTEKIQKATGFWTQLWNTIKNGGDAVAGAEETIDDVSKIMTQAAEEQKQKDDKKKAEADILAAEEAQKLLKANLELQNARYANRERIETAEAELSIKKEEDLEKKKLQIRLKYDNLKLEADLAFERTKAQTPAQLALQEKMLEQIANNKTLEGLEEQEIDKKFREEELKKYSEFLQKMNERFKEYLIKKKDAFDDEKLSEEESDKKFNKSIIDIASGNAKQQVVEDKFAEKKLEKKGTLKKKEAAIDKTADDEYLAAKADLAAKENDISQRTSDSIQKIEDDTNLTRAEKDKYQARLQVEAADEKALEVRKEADQEVQIEQDKLDKIKELRKKNVKDAIESTKEMLDAAAEGAIKASEEVQKANEYRIHQNEDFQNTQAALAEAGQRNTLAQTAKHQQELENQQEEEQYKQKKIKELETFVNSVAKFAETDPKTAVPKALGVLAATKAVEAIYAEKGGVIGMNDSHSLVAPGYFSKRHRGGNDVLLHAEKGEGILSVKEMSNLGFGNFMEMKEMLQNPVREKSIAPASAILVNNNAEVVERLENLGDRFERAIGNIPDNTAAWDAANREWIVTEIRDGLKTITRQQQKQIRI